MSMDDFQCDMLELNFEFAREDLDVDAFLEAVGELDPDGLRNEEGNLEVALSFGSPEEIPKPHAHLMLRLDKEGKGSVELRFHNSTMDFEGENARPPHVYECGEWLSRFFRGDKIDAHLHAAYIFDESFAPTVTLPFPLVSSEKELAGALVLGISMLLPKEHIFATASLQTIPKGPTYLFITTTGGTNLKDFNLSTELERIAPSVKTLVTRRDADEQRSNIRKDESGRISE